jgi:hypothetical protein
METGKASQEPKETSPTSPRQRREKPFALRTESGEVHLRQSHAMAVEVEGRRVNEHLRQLRCELMLEGGDDRRHEPVTWPHAWWASANLLCLPSVSQ